MNVIELSHKYSGEARAVIEAAGGCLAQRTILPALEDGQPSNVERWKEGEHWLPIGLSGAS